MPTTKLSTLLPGESAIISGISADETLHHRLTALGFRIGREISLVRRGWFRGPLQLRIGTTEIIMRRIDAEKIRIAVQSPR